MKIEKREKARPSQVKPRSQLLLILNLPRSPRLCEMLFFK